jgi:hypothetical protein
MAGIQTRDRFNNMDASLVHATLRLVTPFRAEPEKKARISYFTVLVFTPMRHIAAVLILAVPAMCADTALTLEQKEQFLSMAKVAKVRGAKKGIAQTVRATLTDGAMTHDASIQRIEQEKARFETDKGTEINFRDSWQFNIAAYKLGRLLGLQDMIPPSIERPHEGRKGAWTWWVENVAMDETERAKKKLNDPDKDHWARQYQIMKVFDQLICNMDRNQQNILYDKEWKLWMIDHTRAFRIRTAVPDGKSLTRCDRELLTRMKALNTKALTDCIGKYVRPSEIKGLLARRDQIVAHFEKLGPKAMYDFLPTRPESDYK